MVSKSGALRERKTGSVIARSECTTILKPSGDCSPPPSPTTLGYDHDRNADTDDDSSQVSSDSRTSNDAQSDPGCNKNTPNAQLKAESASQTDSEVKSIRAGLVHIRYRGTWYDVTRWRTVHPAGSHWLDWFDGRDATEIIDALHSAQSRLLATRLPKAKPEIAAKLEANAEPDSKVQIAFRKLFDTLVAEGWWERDMRFELTQLGIWAVLIAGAVATARTNYSLSAILLGLSFTGAGWLGHDYTHGLDKFSKRLRTFACYTVGFSPRWWSDKHNKHHALTNEVGVDEDMQSDPVLYTFPPDPSQDSPLRKLQHFTFWIPFGVLFLAWRKDSILGAIYAVDQKRPHAKDELYGIVVHYMLLFSLFPFLVWFPALILSGIASALVVTSTHQSEEKFTDFIADHVTRQFRCTRSVVMSNPFSAWIWGGMQHQIEHHLFPSMPRHRLPQLKPIMQKFARENNVQSGYRESGEFEILKMNWDTYRETALADPVVGAPSTAGVPGQQGAIIDGFSSVNPYNKKKKDN